MHLIEADMYFFLPRALLPCQELTIRHVKQLTYMDFSEVILRETRNENSMKDSLVYNNYLRNPAP